MTGKLATHHVFAMKGAKAAGYETRQPKDCVMLLLGAP